MKRRKDYQAHYYLPLTNPANVMREEKEQGDRIQYHNVDTLMSEGFPADLGDRDSDLTDHFDDYKGGEDMQTSVIVCVNCQFLYRCNAQMSE